ncbi:hypothetical protein COCMIDRAFT_4567 [Bipolaris oryzae ATCC 44560]|uniref:Uncharacterized protein n=1 Tax=Bipolaris oryzae ATCC 44560 TaxID=930090 RepID=W6ZRT4_COCMI|nr:uncharacterized protein COCMIDRAFT_4567 [Bipolaris oryzae ATCC 44560]EUC46406.1 hypothetical protein COCMIDRAFT_4567 [Bipolaris oryzae ATCC 44560]
MVAGNNSVPMTDLVKVLIKMRSYMVKHQDEDLFPMRNIINLHAIVRLQRNVRQNQHRGNPGYVLELFRETEWFEMTVPNDRLYALYGLAGGIRFPVNSDRRYCHQKMFVDFAVWALKEFSGLVLLSYTRAIGGGCHCNVPSWAPCYDMDCLPVSLLHVSHFNACGRLFEPKYKFQSLSELQIAGAIIDTIKSVCDDLFNLASIEAHSKSLKSGAKFAGCEDLVGERYKKYCAALLLELDAENGRAPQSLIDLMDERIKNGSSPEYEKAEEVRTSWERFRCLCTTVGDRFVWASRRKPGLGWHSNNTKPGDNICIFKGV